MMQPVPPTAPGQGYGYGYGYGYGASGPVQVKKRGVLGWLVRAVVALFAVVLLIGVAGGFYAVYQVMFGDNPPPALDGYMHGHGVAYHVPHGVLTVRLPDTPELQPDNVALGDRTLNGQISDVKRDTYEVGVGMVDAPATGTAALHGAMAGIGTRFNMNAASTKDITIAGQPAVEGHGTFQGDQVAVAVSIVKGKLYLLIVHTKTGAVDVLHEFEASARLDSRK